MKNNIKQINPALLVTTFEELQKQVDSLLSVTNEFDIDIIDWNRSFIKTVPVTEVIELNRFVKLNYDVMMDKPEETIDTLIKSQTASRITINLEADSSEMPLVKKIKAAGLEAGISLNPEDKATDVIKFFPYIEYIQIMTIEPGQQGNPFIAGRLAVSLELRELGFDGLIGVDGGVNRDTIPTILNYPINILSVGSTLSKSFDPATTYTELKDLIKPT